MGRRSKKTGLSNCYSVEPKPATARILHLFLGLRMGLALSFFQWQYSRHSPIKVTSGPIGHLHGGHRELQEWCPYDGWEEGTGMDGNCARSCSVAQA